MRCWGKQEMQMQNKKCLKCGSKKFRQEVSEIYDRYLDNNGQIISFEDELMHDFEFGKIRCVKCGLELRKFTFIQQCNILHKIKAP